MQECSKAIPRRLRDSRFARHYFVGEGIDIGCGPDPLVIYHEFFPRMETCEMWDQGQGDAQTMPGVLPQRYNFIHASHVLEHVHDPEATLRRWADILRPGGHVVVLVPEKYLYEKSVWPSLYNEDHKTAWHMTEANEPHERAVLDLLYRLRDLYDVCKVEVLDETYRHTLPLKVDQTQTPVGECAIEFVLRRKAA